MGQKHVKPLRQEDIVKNLSTNTLVNIIGKYYNGEETFATIRQVLSRNWECRGNNATKEHIDILCTAGVQGQGKTELCKQLCQQNCTWGLKGVKTMVTIPISFNQDCTFAKSELLQSDETCIVWRILRAFGICDDDFSKYPSTLNELIRLIRRSNCSEGSRTDSVGVFLLVDEIMKVEFCDKSFFRRVLDIVTTLQQRQLRDGFPTFVLITSLKLLPVSHHLVEGSGRRVQCISLPIFCDMDLDGVTDKINAFFHTVLCIDKTPAERQRLVRYKNLQNLIRIVVSVSGRHFRTLELALGVVYGHLVSGKQHEMAKSMGFSDVDLFRPKICDQGNVGISSKAPITTKKRHSTDSVQLSVFDRKGSGVDFAVRDVFMSIVSNMDMAGVNIAMYENVKDLFFELIINPSLTKLESEVYHLESYNLVYIKNRDPDRTMHIVPRVSLPLMYFFLSGAGDVSQQRPSGPKTLNLHTDTLLSMIGQQLSRPYRELPAAFEAVMPIVELITVAAHLRMPNRVIALEDLLPGAVFCPWGKETLRVAPFVMASEITLFTPTNDSFPADHEQQTQQTRAVCGAVQMALSSDCSSVYIHQTESVNMEQIEHVSRLFSLAGQQQAVPCFCSMKIREGTKPASLARSMHNFIIDHIQPSKSYSLQDESYYVVIYCCCDDVIALEDLPPGTVVVPYKTVRSLLYPFGLNQLALMAEEKAKAGKKK